MIKIIVCGAGEIGGQICRHLAHENCELTVIDRNDGLLRSLSDRLDIIGITGEAADPHTLRQAKVAEADLIVATTPSDHTNIVVCLVAKNLSSRITTVARLRDRRYRKAVEGSGLALSPVDRAFTPELNVAEQITQLLESPALLGRRTILAETAGRAADRGEGERAYFVGLRLEASCSLLHTPLRQLSSLFTDLDTVVVGLRRKGRLGLALPEDQLFENDEVYLCTADRHYERTVELFGKRIKNCRRVVLVGGGKVGTEVALRLEAAGVKFRARLIESDRRRAEHVADTLDRTVVLHGDGLDKDILEEANIGSADAIVAMTQDDKSNLVMASQAKKLAEGILAVSLVNDPFLFPLSEPLDIDAIVDPRDAAVSMILSFSRGRQVTGVGIVGERDAEIIEVELLSEAAFAGRRIRNAGLPKDVMVGAVKKGRRIVKPEPDTKLEAGDRIAFFALHGDVQELIQMLGPDAAVS
ncbi:MAG: Trk system potassium transporter TrkA [Rhodobacteraceae bacterium]|nr:Trk system potassium transporter TrkA [Paracoccaceae bacterium]